MANLHAVHGKSGRPMHRCITTATDRCIVLNSMSRYVQDVPDDKKASMLVVSEFVGCSPSLSGAIRVNPWNVDSVADGIYAAIKMPVEHRHLRHAKHWRYVSSHTAAFWAKASGRDGCKLSICFACLHTLTCLTLHVVHQLHDTHVKTQHSIAQHTLNRDCC